ncbi:MAG: peptide chain release factor N(5)-glutamine methyltransferase [Oscillospiraceae bacterium]|nr:peptide chain release factor N(5)-glutamine methyltransferase [Oscillospiraceae bacterium]
MKTYNDIYIQIRNMLRNAGIETYSQEARLIVSSVSGKNPQEFLRDLRLYTSPSLEKKAVESAERRIAGEPIAYILGEWEFYGLPLYVTKDVLIPRADTEIIVEAAVDLLTGSKMDARILDLCCGSGCITCAVAHELPASKIIAVDISHAALEICRKNIALNRLSSRAICMQADATMNPPASLGAFDMIISNPPYIASSEIAELDSSVRDYEPVWALDGGEDGLRFYKGIIKYWKSLLKEDGCILFEVGEGQAETVGEMLLSAGFRSVSYRKDTLGTDRVVIGSY